MNQYPSYYKYWGKADREDSSKYHLLPYHCLDVAACAQVLLLKQTNLLEKIRYLSGLTDTQIINWLTFLYSIHDLGKFGEGFQGQKPELQKFLNGHISNIQQSIRHDTVGYELLRAYLAEWLNRSDLKEKGGSSLRLWISAIAGHHGRPPRNDSNAALLLRDNFPPEVIGAIKAFVFEIVSLFLPSGCPVPENEKGLTEKYKQVSWLVAGLAVVADWLGSNSLWFPFINTQINLSDYWNAIAIPQAEKAVVESGLAGVRASAFHSISDLFDYIARPTYLQSWAEKVPIVRKPQLFILEELTGSGKTEAAIVLASRLMEKGQGSGLYIALPTMATADGMFDRFRIKERYKRLFADGKASLVLAHSADRLRFALEEANRVDSGYGGSETETASRQCTAWLSDNRKKALLADFGVGTIDQAFLSILSAKHQSLRLFGLSSKVLIIDEVHACDGYMGELLRVLLHFHAAMGGSAILLSATLPKAQREAYITAFSSGINDCSPCVSEVAYPLASHFSANGLLEQPILARSEVSRIVKIHPVYDNTAIYDHILNSLNNGRCIVWIRNTVFDAVDAWQKLKNISQNHKAVLFHARFALVDRLRIGKEIENNFGNKSGKALRESRVVIATQVIEQSLDVDFDDMVTDLAPIDLMIQRAGRLQRHSRDASGDRITEKDERGGACLKVLMPESDKNLKANWYSEMFPKAQYVYPDHGKLWLTANWLVKNKQFKMPEQARDMVEYVYSGNFDTEVPPSLVNAMLNAEGIRLGGQSMADFNSLNFNTGYDPTGIKWKEEDNAPTRLGEKTVRVRLAKVTETGLLPWAETHTGMEWSLSELSVAYRLIKGEGKHWQAEVETVRKTMKDEGKYVVIIPLEKIKEGLWRGYAININDEEVNVFYSPVTGLQISMEEDYEFD